MNDLNNIFPWLGGASVGLSQNERQSQMLNLGLQGLHNSDRARAVSYFHELGPEERSQAEIAEKNATNYARWLLRLARDPLQDAPH